MTNNVNILAPFGPKIARLKIPKNLISKMNKEIDKIVDSQNLSKKFDYSKELVGQVSQELQLPKNFINKYLKNFLCFTYLKANLLTFFFAESFWTTAVCIIHSNTTAFVIFTIYCIDHLFCST